jgi:DNA invertase Pin-like site-specific DNA recombinase
MEVACYARVSTDDQNLSRQIRSTIDHADSLGADIDERFTGKELTTFIEDELPKQGWGKVPLGEAALYFDRSTGTDTQRAGYRDLMDGVENYGYDAVVVHSVSRISRSIRDLDRTAERIVEGNDTEFHIISEGFELVPERSEPFQRAMFQLLGVFAELEAKLAQQRAREGIAARQKSDNYHHGRAPLGFEKDNGELHEAPNYDSVCSVLDMVAKDDLSKRKAAKNLNTSRKTIDRALDRGELYGL